jgi:tRNA (guanosine-2'-O-)-methyltransferase
VTGRSAPRSGRDVRAQRRSRQHSCWGHLIAAPLWPQHGVNLGTLLRSCDATGACLAVPRWPWVEEALRRGDTLPRGARPCVHRVVQPITWLEEQARNGADILGVELLDGAVTLGQLAPARQRTIVVLGNEGSGIPLEAIDSLTSAVEIPMIGVGASLNVAVAGTLVLYRLAGLA